MLPPWYKRRVTDPEWKRLSETSERAQYRELILMVAVRRRWGTAPSVTYWEVRRGPRILLYGNEKTTELAKEAARLAADKRLNEEAAAVLGKC